MLIVGICSKNVPEIVSPLHDISNFINIYLIPTMYSSKIHGSSRLGTIIYNCIYDVLLADGTGLQVT